MRRIEITVLLAVWLGFGGCASTISVSGGKSILNLPRERVFEFLEKIGCSNNGAANYSRSTTGDLLFIQFQDPAGAAKVAIVSSNGIKLRTLPGGFARLNDEGEVVFWRDEREKNLHFVSGHILATNIYWDGLATSDARFVTLFGGNREHWWIGRVQAPLEELVTIGGTPRPQRVVSYGDKLHVFVGGPPGGKPKDGVKAALKHYQYRVEGDKAKLLQILDFYETWSVMDFDPENNLLHSTSPSAEFAHGWLINTVTGERKKSGYGPGRGIFLSDGVIQRFQEALRGRPVFVPPR